MNFMLFPFAIYTGVWIMIIVAGEIGTNMASCL